MLANLKPKEWKEKREALEKELEAIGYTHFSRIIRSDVLAVSLEGCSLQIQYRLSSRELCVWGRGGSRYAGGTFKLAELIAIRDAFRKWHDEHIKL